MIENGRKDKLTSEQHAAFLKYTADMMNYWQGYHAQKERMYITSTTLFVAGSFAGSSYLFNTVKILSIFDLSIIAVGYIALCVSFFGYRNLQFKYKKYASFIADAHHMQLPRLQIQTLYRSDLSIVSLDTVLTPDKAKQMQDLVKTWQFPNVILPGFKKLIDREDLNSLSILNRTLIPPVIGVAAFIFSWSSQAAFDSFGSSLAAYILSWF